MIFDSYHWLGATLGTPELERARALVSTTRDRAAFEILLRSDEIAAVGIALDQYQYGEATSRWGSANPFEGYSAEVVERARMLLRQPPSPGSDQAEPGANHASALTALTNLIEQQDVEFVLQALNHGLTADLLGAARSVAGRLLEDQETPDSRLVIALERMVMMRLSP